MEITLENTFGAALLGAVAATMLFGITLVQTYMYYRYFPEDWMFQKIAVAFLLALDIVHAVFTIAAIYYYLIDKFGNETALQYLSWSFKLQVVFNVVIIVVVQALYAWRVYILGRHFSLIWPCLTIALVATGWAFGLVLVVKTYGLSSFAAIHELQGLLNGVFISATVIDFSVATAICYYIQTNRTTFHGTNNRIVRVMRYVLICGFLTSACSLSALIAYTTMPNNLVFLGIDFLLPHLYLNSYLAMLNARHNARDHESTFDASECINYQMRAVDQSESINTGTDSKIHQSKAYHNGVRGARSMPVGITLQRTDERREGQAEPSAGSHNDSAV